MFTRLLTVFDPVPTSPYMEILRRNPIAYTLYLRSNWLCHDIPLKVIPKCFVTFCNWDPRSEGGEGMGEAAESAHDGSTHPDPTNICTRCRSSGQSGLYDHTSVRDLRCHTASRSYRYFCLLFIIRFRHIYDHFRFGIGFRNWWRRLCEHSCQVEQSFGDFHLLLGHQRWCCNL